MVKNPPANARDVRGLGSIPGSGRSPGGGHGGPLQHSWGFPGGSDSKESACNTGDPGLNFSLGRSPGEGHGNPLQYSGLWNPMDKGALRAAVPGITNIQTQLGS